nr:zinc finger, CCHC-type [Tanacetum cinerariifolium]
MDEDASSKKFLVRNFTNYKMTDSRLVMEQYNELLGILGRFTQHKMNMDEAIQVSCIIDKLPHSWKDFKHTLKHKKEELTLFELGSHLRIEESLMAQDSDKTKRNNVGCREVVRLPDPKLKTLGERGIECIFVGYAEHSKAFRFYVIEPNDSVEINSINESRDAIFDENRFSSVPRPSLSIPKGTEAISGSVVPKVVTDEKQEMRSLNNTPIALMLRMTPKHLMKQYSPRMLLSGKKQLMMRWTPLWETTLGCWLIYLQVANLMVANGSSEEN